MTRLVLVTGHEFGIRAFEGLMSSAAYLDGRIEVPLIIGLPDPLRDPPVGYRSIVPLAAEHGTGWAFTSDGRLRSLAGMIDAADPDYMLVIGWSRLIPGDVLAIPAEGCIGMHPSPLPAGRGRAPIPWTIIKGLEQTALSVFRLVPDADAGEIIAQYRMIVRSRETGASLFTRMAAAHFRAGTDLGGALGAGRVLSRRQEGAVSVWPKRTPDDGQIQRWMTVAQADALARAQLGPYPRAWITEGGRRVAVRPARADMGGAFGFACKDGTVWLARDGE